MKIEELEKLFEKSYGYNKTSIWNINGLTVDAKNIDDKVIEKLDIELNGCDSGHVKKEVFHNPLIMTKRGKKYFIKVELENERILDSVLDDYEPTYDLMCCVEGYWNDGDWNEDYRSITLKGKKACVWRLSDLKHKNNELKMIIGKVNETIDLYFLEEVLTKIIKHDLYMQTL